MITLNGLLPLTSIIGLLAITLALANLLALSRMAHRLRRQKEMLDALSAAIHGRAAAKLGERLRTAARADAAARPRPRPMPVIDNER